MKVSHSLLQLVWVVICLPMFILCLPQAILVKRNTIRLPEATGTRQRLSKDTSALHILHIGESTVAGVGVEDINQGLTANIAKQLSKVQNTPVSWSAFGENGIRLAGLNQLLPNTIRELTEKSIPEPRFDLAIITMGVNDSTKFTSLKQWRASIQDTIQSLKPHMQGPLFFTQVPPLAQFPALPSPLKYVLGIRSTLLDYELQKICTKTKNVHYIGSKLQVTTNMMAIDGYHPSELGYQHWAKQVAAQIHETLS